MPVSDAAYVADLLSQAGTEVARVWALVAFSLVVPTLMRSWRRPGGG